MKKFCEMVVLQNKVLMTKPNIHTGLHYLLIDYGDHRLENHAMLIHFAYLQANYSKTLLSLFQTFGVNFTS